MAATLSPVFGSEVRLSEMTESYVVADNTLYYYRCFVAVWVRCWRVRPLAVRL